MDRKILFAMALFLILPSVMSAATITLELVEINNTDEIVATSVFDNDGSIGFVDLFVSSQSGVTRKTFINVTEGQILNLNFNPNDTVAYNYNDVDGTIFGLGVNLLIQGTSIGSCNQPNGCPPDFTPEVLKSLKLTPRLAPGNSAYFVDAVADVNLSHTINSIVMDYGLNSSVLSQSIIMTFDGTQYVGTLGPFDQKLRVEAQAIAVDGFNIKYSARDLMWFELFLPPDESCSIGQVVTTQAPVENFESDSVSLAELTGTSYLEISISSSGKLTATTVIDDDSSIEEVDIFFQTVSIIVQTIATNF